MSSIYDLAASVGVDTHFLLYGTQAEYYPQSGAPALDVTVIRKRTEAEGQIANGRFTQSSIRQVTAWAIDVRRSEVALPKKGDSFVLDDAAYEIADQPVLDEQKLVWSCPLRGD